MPDLTLHLDLNLKMGKRSARCAMAAAMILAAAPELASENMSLTTYYPAPSGVYAQMITTGNTFLARDGGAVSVGTAVSPPSGTSFAVMKGNSGFGTLAPTATLEVAGTFRLATNPANDYVLTSDANGNATWRPGGGIQHVRIVSSSMTQGPTQTVRCPNDYHLVTCVVEVFTADGQGYHQSQGVQYTDANGNSTANDPVGCHSTTTDTKDSQICRAYCVK